MLGPGGTKLDFFDFLFSEELIFPLNFHLKTVLEIFFLENEQEIDIFKSVVASVLCAFSMTKIVLIKSKFKLNPLVGMLFDYQINLLNYDWDKNKLF